MSELISVVVPVYNVKPYLEKCIDSILHQTYQDLEVLLVDDGATDGSGEICDRYASADARIRVIHKENGGSSSARNRGIEEASGAYIGFVDADDYIAPDMYETLYLALQNYPQIPVSQMMSEEIWEDGSLANGPYKDSGETFLLQTREYFRELILHVGDSSFCTKLFRADFMKKYRFTEHRLNEDFELLLQMIPDLPGILRVEKTGYTIFLRKGSNTRGKYNQKLYENMMENAETVLRMVKEQYPEYQLEGEKFVLTQTLNFLLHIPICNMTRDNALYQQEKKRVKDMRGAIRTNPFFTDRQRKNLRMLSKYPCKMVRRLHKFSMKLRGIKQ